MSNDIAKLRADITALDGALLELLERRFNLAARVGRIKAERRRPVIVREVEREVLSRAREAVEFCGISPEVMEDIFRAIIRGSVERQHRVRVELEARGGALVLVLGAAGAMGGWMRRFLESIGHCPEGVDIAWNGLPQIEGRFKSLDVVPDLGAYDAIFVSVPLESTGRTLDDLAGLSISKPVFEIASIKSHLAEPLARLRQAGTRAISLHPMFGPGKNPYEPLTVVHAVAGDEAEERGVILDLLAHPYLDLVSIPFERHDRMMGWLLGLAHLSGMLFAAALSRSGLDPGELGRVASTTFSRQVATARSVLEEEPGLYYAIQRLNPFRGEVYSALTAALGELTGAVERDDFGAFADLMTRGEAELPGPRAG